jgi:prevent-host-death family protein
MRQDHRDPWRRCRQALQYVIQFGGHRSDYLDVLAGRVGNEARVNERMSDEELSQWFADLDVLIAEIGSQTPPGITAVDVVNDIRRDFGPVKMEPPMAKIGVKEFKTHASEIFRRVRDERESVEVTYRGQVIARVLPVAQDQWPTREEIKQHFAAFDDLATEIAMTWPENVSAVDAVNDVRRDL